jgi:uncharacterized coiled-coil protein SlyX
MNQIKLTKEEIKARIDELNKQLDKIIETQKEKIFCLHKKLGNIRESKINSGAKKRWENKKKGKLGVLKEDLKNFIEKNK